MNGCPGQGLILTWNYLFSGGPMLKRQYPDHSRERLIVGVINAIMIEVFFALMIGGAIWIVAALVAGSR